MILDRACQGGVELPLRTYVLSTKSQVGMTSAHHPPEAGFLLPMPKSKYTDEELAEKKRVFLESISLFGTISAGVRLADVKRHEARSWIERDPEFKERYEEAREEFKDSIENRLLERIDKGENGPTLRFKAKGELPEKYGPLPRKGTKEQESPANVADWEKLEAEALEDGND